jgi:hypothetical protein
MSKKHFESLAEAMRAVRPEPLNHEEKHKLNQWYSTVTALVFVLSRDNPRFDEEKFRAACYRTQTMR